MEGRHLLHYFGFPFILLERFWIIFYIIIIFRDTAIATFENVTWNIYYLKAPHLMLKCIIMNERNIVLTFLWSRIKLVFLRNFETFLFLFIYFQNWKFRTNPDTNNKQIRNKTCFCKSFRVILVHFIIYYILFILPTASS